MDKETLDLWEKEIVIAMESNDELLKANLMSKSTMWVLKCSQLIACLRESEKKCERMRAALKFCNEVFDLEMSNSPVGKITREALKETAE